MTSGENEAAREAAIAEIVRVIQEAVEALEARGRPGIEPHSGSTHTPRTVNGWKVEFGRLDPAGSTLPSRHRTCGCPSRNAVATTEVAGSPVSSSGDSSATWSSPTPAG